MLVQARLLANLLDGMVAIGRGVASPTGELFNEVPDRVSDTAVLVGLGVAAGSVAWGLAAALAAMATAYVRLPSGGGSDGFRATFGGPMAKQHRMALVTGLPPCYAAVLCRRLARPGPGRSIAAALYAITALSLWSPPLRRLAGASPAALRS